MLTKWDTDHFILSHLSHFTQTLTPQIEHHQDLQRTLTLLGG